MVEAITLHDVLPEVFQGMEHDEPVCSSGVWMHQVEFRRGEAYMVRAESGTGKSSLLSFVYGLRSDYTGCIRYDGRDIRNFSALDWGNVRCRSVALLPQEMCLFPELTVRENIEIKNRLTGCKSADEISAMLDILELGHKAGMEVGRLSLGQQQRVALARTLCQPFDFLLMDEPVSHLDSRNNAIVSRLVERHIAVTGAGVIVTSVGYDMALDGLVEIKL